MKHKTDSAYLENSPSIPLHLPLARVFGVNAAIILQQIRYWMALYQKAEQAQLEDKRIHYHDDRWWVYNTYEQWQSDNFDFWSKRTIQRHINDLEDKGVLISGEFNKSSGDRTKWYTINFDVLDELVGQNEGTVNPSSQTVQTISTECPDHLDKVAHSNNIDTETTSETTTEKEKPTANAVVSMPDMLDYLDLTQADLDDTPLDDIEDDDPDPYDFKAIQEHTVNVVFGGNGKKWGAAGDIANWALCGSTKEAWRLMHPDAPFTINEWKAFCLWYSEKLIAWPANPDKWNGQAYEFRHCRDYARYMARVNPPPPQSDPFTPEQLAAMATEAMMPFKKDGE